MIYDEKELQEFVLGEMDKRGFERIDKPKIKSPMQKKCVPFPANLTVLTSGDLGIISSYYAAYASYAYSQLSMVEIALIYSQNAYNFYNSQAWIRETPSYNQKKLLKSIIEAKVFTNKDVVKWVKKIQIYQAEVKLLKALLRSYEKYYDAIQKEMYRRINLIKKGIV